MPTTFITQLDVPVTGSLSADNLSACFKLSAARRLHLTTRLGREEGYREAHTTVWPELIAEVSKAGIRNHNAFVHGGSVFVYLEADDLEKLLSELIDKDVKQRRNNCMEEYLEAETIPLKEVS